MSRPDPLRVVVHAQRYNRPDWTMRRAINVPREDGVGLGVLTESLERRHVLATIDGIGHHSAGACSVWWEDDRFTVLATRRVGIEERYVTERGRSVARTDVPLVALRRDRDGFPFVLGGMHLPRGIEASWDENPDWVQAAKHIAARAADAADELAERHGATLRVIGADFNLDLTRPINRARLRQLMPGYGFGLGQTRGTKGSRRIDGAAVAGGHIAGQRVTLTPVLSDHHRIVTTIQPNRQEASR